MYEGEKIGQGEAGDDLKGDLVREEGEVIFEGSRHDMKRETDDCKA